MLWQRDSLLLLGTGSLWGIGTACAEEGETRCLCWLLGQSREWKETVSPSQSHRAWLSPWHAAEHRAADTGLQQGMPQSLRSGTGSAGCWHPDCLCHLLLGTDKASGACPARTDSSTLEVAVHRQSQECSGKCTQGDPWPCLGTCAASAASSPPCHPVLLWPQIPQEGAPSRDSICTLRPGTVLSCVTSVCRDRAAPNTHPADEIHQRSHSALRCPLPTPLCSNGNPDLCKYITPLLSSSSSFLPSPGKALQPVYPDFNQQLQLLQHSQQEQLAASTRGVKGHGGAAQTPSQAPGGQLHAVEAEARAHA